MKIRKSIFETNSSSTHSIVMEGFNKDNRVYDYPTIDYISSGGEFGWDYDKFSETFRKIDYLVSYLNEQVHIVTWYKSHESWDYDKYRNNNLLEKATFEEIINNMEFAKLLKKAYKDYTGCILLIKASSDDRWSGFGYIDHQSHYLFGSEFIYIDNEKRDIEKNVISKLNSMIEEFPKTSPYISYSHEPIVEEVALLEGVLDKDFVYQQIVEFIFNPNISVIIDNDNH